MTATRDAHRPLSRSLAALWAPPAEEPPPPEVWDVLIVGTGYGGSAAAATFAGTWVDDPAAPGGRRPARIALLERGAALQPGDYPSRLSDLPGHLRLGSTTTGTVGGNAEGLFDVRLGPDVMALVANGVGGGSLINAGVLLEPQAGDLRRPDFQRLVHRLQRSGAYARTRRELGGRTASPMAGPHRDTDVGPATIDDHPAHRQQPLRKAQALRALRRGGPVAVSVPLSVAMQDGRTDDGVPLRACTLCGDCMTGCNVGAKISLDTHWLARAVAAGADLFTGASVKSLRRVGVSSRATGATNPTGAGRPGAAADDRLWEIEVVHTRPDLQARERGPLRLRARRVVLAAGALGSTEILLRSRGPDLVLSPRLGERFSCNGDNLAAVHRLPQPTDGTADEADALDARRVGPTITTSLPMRSAGRPFLLQEFAVPGPMRWLFGEAVTTAHALHRLTEADEQPHGHEPPGSVDPAAVDPQAMARTLLVGLIGHDEARGVLALPPGAALGTLRIHWPGARHGRDLDDALAAVQARVDALRQGLATPPDDTCIANPGTPTRSPQASDPAAAPDGPHLLPNPLWRPLPDALASVLGTGRGPVLTVHPLGGCPFGRTRDDGVVDAFGRVFDGAAADPQAVHEGLVVLDGAIVPESLGANPSLTIATWARHAARHLRRAWGLRAPKAASEDRVRPPIGAQDLGQDDHEDVAAAGDAHRTTCRPPNQRVAAPEAYAPPFPPAPPPPPRAVLLERLVGPVSVRAGAGPPRRWMMELTLEFEPITMTALTVPLQRRLTVDAASPHSQVRLYDAEVWAARGLSGLDDEPRRRHAAFEAPVSGTLTLGQREASRPGSRRWRALRAWWRHRGARDLWQAIGSTKGSRTRDAGTGAGVTAALRDLWHLASRAGEVRRFDYALRVGEARLDQAGLSVTPDGQPGPWTEGAIVIGAKRLTYGARGAAGNPWRQLTEVELRRWPGQAGPAGFSDRSHDAVLRLDPRFLARREAPLLRWVDAPDQVQALTGLASLGLMGLRLLLGTHLWAFRAPDAPSTGTARAPVRLPQAIDGLPLPQITELHPDPGHTGPDGQPVVVRLTRYPAPAGADLQRPALVMVHGYSVSGNTFTHESLHPSAAAHFHTQGRDVWVVDLRTSAGLPTATQPWTMEQVALVDLPAALCHVRQATGAPVDVLAHCIGCVMLSMALLSRPDELQARARALERPVGLSDAQLATLEAFNGRGPAHATVRRVVLSQKGPVLRYTDANVLRAWVMAFLRRWLPPGLQFRPSEAPGMGEALLDRLLASLPYPEADWAVENPWQPWRRTPWTATRHRMDALYGRDFEAAHLRRPTLEAIDDLFGPMHLDTVAQTLHFALLDMATDASGGGEFVTIARLRERWHGLPTLALHGADNGLADVWTQRLLAAYFGAAGLPFEARTYPGMGHQDLLIGRGAKRVFEDIERFLAHADVTADRVDDEATLEVDGPHAVPVESPARGTNRDAASTASGRIASAQSVVWRLPWIGPRVDITQGQRVRIAAMAGLDAGPGRLVLLPVRGSPSAGLRLLDTAPISASPQPQGSRVWQFAEADDLLAETGADADGWVAAMVHANDQAPPGDLDFAWPDLNGNPLRAPAPSARWCEYALLPQGARTWLDRLSRQGPATLWDVFVPRTALARIGPRLARGAGGLPSGHDANRPPPVRMAVASCQYPHGPLDREPAQASLQRMAQRARGGDIDLALFLGDQIYADATAGLVDPLRRDERYEHPHERAQSAPGLRQVLAALPAVMAIDDHELVDNWEPPPPGGGSDAALWALRETSRRDGAWAYWTYERLRPKPREAGAPHTADKIFRFGGLPIFLADTRLGRSSRALGTGNASRAQILSRRTWWQLEAWLLRHRDVLKVVATPSLLLPRRREVASDASAAIRSDGWDGFPASLERLLDFMARHRLGRTVFLSGDEHHAMRCDVTLQAPARHGQPGPPPVHLLSLHSSALYAPFPFANGRPADFSDTPFETRRGTRVSLHTTPAPSGDGFAIVTAEPGATALEALGVEWVRGGSD